MGVTASPTAAWVTQQLRAAFPFDGASRYLLMDRDAIFSAEVSRVLKHMEVRPVRTSFQSPWQNGVAERWVGTCRRELLDHVIVLNEQHLRRLLREFLDYYHRDRTHLALGKDSPSGRTVWPPSSPSASVTSVPRIGGLHHRYEWREAA
jgi:putative transposase